jgi:hypothetical protein
LRPDGDDILIAASSISTPIAGRYGSVSNARAADRRIFMEHPRCTETVA